MQEFFDQLRTKSGFEVIDKTESWKTRIFKPTVKQTTTKQEFWSDWMDYYVVDRDKTDLRSEMKQDIERFVRPLIASTVRLVDSNALFGRRKRLEWLKDNGWEKVSLI